MKEAANLSDEELNRSFEEVDDDDLGDDLNASEEEDCDEEEEQNFRGNYRGFQPEPAINDFAAPPPPPQMPQ